MTATEVLRAEHEVIRRMLAILGELAKDALRGELDPAEAEEAIDFFRTFADRCHHGKEEGELFPAMEEEGVARAGGPLGVMLDEHEQGRAAIRAMAEDLVRVRAGERGAAADFAASARPDNSLLEVHIRTENEVLFPLAERILPAVVKERLIAAFDGIERNEMEPGTHERYHAMIEEMERKRERAGTW